MAQRKRKRGSLARKLGLGRKNVLLAALTFVVVLGAGGATLASMANSQLIVRRSKLAYGSDALASRSISAENVLGEESGTPGTGDTAQAGADGPEAGIGEERVSDSCIVHVDGAVTHPGVYKLTQDDVRVGDAVDAAGGLREEADTSRLNLAAPLTDGSKVHVPTKDELLAGSASGASAAGSELTSGLAGEIGASGADAMASSLVNINTADVAALTALPGVGEATARAIIEDREQNGSFSSPEDIMRVSGIGQKKYERMKSLIVV